jgi:MSHA biogenesis protein MshP
MSPDIKKALSIKKQSGIGLPMALFIITILAMIIAAITDLEESSGVSFGLDVNSMRAFYAAESGAQADMAKIFPASGSTASCSSQTSTFSFTTSGLNGCGASVARTCVTVDSIAYFTLRSTGSCGSGLDKAKRVIDVRARQ